MPHISTPRLACTALLWLVAGSAMATELDAQNLNCVILPDEVVDISSSVPGVLEAMLVDRSDRIEKGQVLARMESSVEQAVNALAGARAAAISELRLREAELGYDEQHRDRLTQLQQRHVASSQSLEDAERTAEAAHWRLRLAQERREEAQLDQQRARAILNQKTIRSPIDGVVIARHHSVGEHVNSEPVVTVARLNPLRVEVLTPIDMFGKITPGMVMDVRAEVDPDTRRLARVVAVDPVADAGSGMFAVELTLPNPDNALPAGIKCYSAMVDEHAPAIPGPAAPAEPSSTVAAAPSTFRTVPQQATAQTASAHGHESPVSDQSLCRVFPSVVGAATSSRIVSTAVALGGHAHKTPTQVPVVNGYIVATPQADSQQLRQWQQRLRDAGERDTAILQRGEFARRLTMGAYNGPQSAERRRAHIEELGINAEVLPRTRQSSGWDIEVQLPQPLPAPARSAPLAQFVERLRSEAVPCNDARAASL